MTRELQTLLRRIGRRLAELRRVRGWTQERLAERLGVSLKYVQRLEAGQHNITVGTLLSLARSLGATVPNLLEEPASLVANPGRPRRQPVAVAPEAPRPAPTKTTSSKKVRARRAAT